MIKIVGSKRGDTLIEVMFAVGIFSLVAIAVISVMNGSMRSVQLALETTMARNEIDVQAEALRFIQSSAIAEKDLTDGEKVYTKAWNKIIDFADANMDDGGEIKNGATNFSPKKCEDLYDKNEDGNVFSQNAFIVNTHVLGQLNTGGNDQSILKVSDKFSTSGVNPRIIYDDQDANTELVDESTSKTISRVEGIYVVGVPDEKKTYYDFYIRTCWNGAGAKSPSTISTVIRLYNPSLNN